MLNIILLIYITIHVIIKFSDGFSASANSSPRIKKVDASPPRELLRCRAYKRCRKRLQETLIQQGCNSRRGWVRSFERWQLVGKLLEDLDGNDDVNNELSTLKLDPMIPTKQCPLSQEILIQDLTALEGMDASKASIVAKDLAEYSRKMAEGVSKLKDEVLNAPGVGLVQKEIQENKIRKWNSKISNTENAKSDTNTKNKTKKVKESEKKISIKELPIVLLHMGEHTDQKLSITQTAFDNLYKKWRSNNPRIPTRKFLNEVFCLLIRYTALEAWGYQAALTPEVFTCLNTHFDVNTECFASALNHHYPYYYSMFPDLERNFGSGGSFFDSTSFNPDEGSFEANPPFVQVFMLEMLFKMHRLLSKASGPLSFAIIVPVWKEEESWVALNSSPYLSHEPIVIEAEDHAYADGSGYRRSDWDGRARPAPFPSGVFFLQNEQGKEKWPVTQVKVDALRKSFMAANPDENLVKRIKSSGLYTPKKYRGNKD